MALPRKLKHLNMFLDGDNWIGVGEEYTPAKLTLKLEAYRGGGMPGAAHINMGLDDGALDTEFTFGGYEAALFKKQHQAKIDGVMLRFAGSFQRDDTARSLRSKSFSVAASKSWMAAPSKPATTPSKRSAWPTPTTR